MASINKSKSCTYANKNDFHNEMLTKCFSSYLSRLRNSFSSNVWKIKNDLTLLSFFSDYFIDPMF